MSPTISVVSIPTAPFGSGNVQCIVPSVPRAGCLAITLEEHEAGATSTVAAIAGGGRKVSVIQGAVVSVQPTLVPTSGNQSVTVSAVGLIPDVLYVGSVVQVFTCVCVEGGFL